MSRWYKPPITGVVCVTVGVVAPVSPVASLVSSGWSDCCSARRKNTLMFVTFTVFGFVFVGSGLTWMSLTPMFGSASSAASMAGPFAL